jgi:tRNA(Arg) A34 adenosine deaminase TadA
MLGAMMIDPWAAVDPVWRPCFELAWESFQVGSLAVGAVLVDGAGSIVSAGRNRRNEQPEVRGQLSGSSVAHAEINALAMLPVSDYPDHVLYTTLEPCLLCTAALRLSHIGTVRFAAPDPLWYGLDRIPEINHNLARRWTRREGPLFGPLRIWAEVLPLTSIVERALKTVLDAYARTSPGMVELAQKLAPRIGELRRLHLDQALDAVWGDITS